VKVTGAHTVGVVSAVTDDVVGVVQNKPQTVGAAATVAIRGATRVVSDAAITAGAAVYISADGQATSSDSAGTATRLGTALTTTSAAGELVVVLLKL
jgi:hypothetical protein